MKFNHIELAWAAGFFDGEGHSGIFKTHNNLGSVLNISQIEISTLNRFKYAIMNLGNVLGPYRGSKSRPNAQYFYQWKTTKFEYVQAIICLLWNYSSLPKRKQMTETLNKMKIYFRRSSLMGKTSPL